MGMHVQIETANDNVKVRYIRTCTYIVKGVLFLFVLFVCLFVLVINQSLYIHVCIVTDVFSVSRIHFQDVKQFYLKHDPNQM